MVEIAVFHYTGLTLRAYCEKIQKINMYLSLYKQQNFGPVPNESICRQQN